MTSVPPKYKDQIAATINNTSLDIPFLFTITCVILGRIKKNEKKRISEVKQPSAASSELWRDYYRKKQGKKRHEEQAKEKRKGIRKEKLTEKFKEQTIEKPKTDAREKATRKIFKPKNDPKKVKADARILAYAADASKKITDRVFKIDYVIVDYLGTKYPGIIENIRDDETFMSVMVLSGNNWGFPEKDDSV